MKMKSLVYAAFILILGITQPAFSFTLEELQDKNAKVDQLFAEMNKPDSPGAAVVIVKDGKIVYQNEFGSANLEYSIPITSSTVFHVASVSKQFTAFSVALLADRGKLSLDDDIREYLPEVPDFGEKITIRHLISHTSGLRDQWELLGMAGVSLQDVITTEHILKLVSHQKELNFSPGSEIVYCNTGYTLLAEIVARVSGKSFREFTDENIFKPLGMTNSFFYDDHQEIVKNRAYPYFIDEQEGIIKGIINYSNVGATSLFTTSRDMAKWLINLGTAKVGGPKVVKQMFQPGEVMIFEDTGYGFGLVISEFEGQMYAYHGGFDAGYRAYMSFFPEHNFGMAILGNYPLDTYEIGKNIARIYLADVLVPSPPEPQETEEESDETKKEEPTLTAEQMREFTGEFYSDELQTNYEVTLKHGKLTIEHWRNENVILSPIDEDQFTGDKWWVGTIKYTRDKNGEITGFNLSTTGVRNLRFERK